MKIKGTKVLHATDWLVLKEATFIDKNGKTQHWQYVERKAQREVVTLICCSRDNGEILLIQQPRVSINAIEISFPAGLVDKGESLEDAALRELKEETGYSGTILSISPMLPKSSGLSNESTALLVVDTKREDIGETEMEGTEDITSFWIHPSVFFDYISDLDLKKYRIAHEVYSFMLGFKQANMLFK